VNRKLTIRLDHDLLAWLKKRSGITRVPMARLVREHLEDAKAKEGKQRFLRHMGAISGGSRDLSSRKGFSRS
jgi:hypothetical protein